MGNRLYFQIPIRYSDQNGSAICLNDAIHELALFLQEHPDFIEYQDEIDRLLNAAGNSESRMSVIRFLLEANMIKLYDHLSCLTALMHCQ